MPFVRIDVNQGRTPGRLQALSRGIHGAIVAECGIPERDYFHVLTEHPAGQIVAQDAGLGFERTPDVVMIQIFTQAGRSQKAKESLFAAIAENSPASESLARMCSLATSRTLRGTGRSVLAGRSTSPANWGCPASSPQGRAGRRQNGRTAEVSVSPCHVVNMSVQTFDSTWILRQSS